MQRKTPRPRRLRVLVFGAFDFFHPGHRSFFRQAKQYGHELIVAIGRDQVVTAIKRHTPHFSERERLARVAAEPIVNHALLAPHDPRRRYTFIKKLRPHVIALGHDQAAYTENLQPELRRRGIAARVVRLRPFRRHQYQSSLLRKKLH